MTLNHEALLRPEPVQSHRLLTENQQTRIDAVRSRVREVMLYLNRFFSQDYSTVGLLVGPKYISLSHNLNNLYIHQTYRIASEAHSEKSINTYLTFAQEQLEQLEKSAYRSDVDLEEVRKILVALNPDHYFGISAYDLLVKPELRSNN